MKAKQDLLNIADLYQNNFDDDTIDTQCIKDIFKEVISDYKRMVSKCNRQKIDIGTSEEEQFQKLFDKGSIEEKKFAITDLRERVLYLIDLCPNLPRNIRKKYCKDLVDLIDDGFTVFED